MKKRIAALTSQSIEEKINYRLVLIGLLSLVLTAAFCILFFHRAFTQQIWNDLASEGRQIALAYEYLQEPAELTRFAGEDLRVTLIDPAGEVLYESATEEPLENHLTRPEIQQALAEGAGQDARQSQTLNYHTYYYAQRLADGNLLRVARQAGNIYAVYDKMLPAVLFSCLFILVISVGLSMALTRQLVRPILKMADSLDLPDPQAPYRELQPFIEALVADRKLRENSAQMRQDFTANVSHELKTPLTSISGYAELISTGMARPADVKGFAQKIHTESQRMLRLVGDIIQLSELDTLSARPERRPGMSTVDLQEVAKGCIESLALAAKKHFVTLEQQGPHTLVQGEENLLEELCYNLCDNAIRYNKPGGRVTISTGALGGIPFLQVQDTGIGIPAESQPRIFERFYRVDKSRSKATGGTGLGLAIVKHVAQIHGARIKVESTLGAGTTITVLFEGRAEPRS